MSASTLGISDGEPISNKTVLSIYFPLIFAAVPPPSHPSGLLAWPIDCIPGETCYGNLGFPDIDEDGMAFNCSLPRIFGHGGTDIDITWDQMDRGVSVLAAADGEVLWVFDGKYDRCPSSHPDCQPSGYTVCTDEGDYCAIGGGSDSCHWCFAGGNVIVIRHFGVDGIFATRYDHLRTNSILVSPGEFVSKGQKVAEVGSAGASTGPHLHFEVWGTGFYELADPWAGSCGPNFNKTLWDSQIPLPVPGDTCATGQIYDCVMGCVDQATAFSWVGDGSCDDGTWGMNLQCSAFNNDGGDCN